MERFDSPPIPLSSAIRAGEFDSAQLVFYDVDHSGRSFEAAVFLATEGANAETPLDPEHGFAGSFVIFGHGGCVGDVGHCEVPTEPKDAFDSRPPHALTPQTKTVDIGEALRRVHDAEHLQVSVLAIVPGDDRAELADVLRFSAMRLLTYA
jgi:hypothetical protein